jgi:hypothetical protein
MLGAEEETPLKVIYPAGAKLVYKKKIIKMPR